MSIPGLPSLPPETAALFSIPSLLSEDGADVSSTSNSSQWGVFLNGDPVVVADNVLSMEFKQDFRISNYPVEQGAFASYNKVQTPMEVRFRFSSGSDKSGMLNSISAVIGDTNLYDIVTPDATYMNFNFTHQDYRRTAQSGVGLLSVDVWCEEVRTASLIVDNSGTSNGTSATPAANGQASVFDTGTTGIINAPQSPSASPQVNGGQTTAVTPSAAEVTQFNNAMPLP